MFTGHNDWQHPDVRKISTLVVMHSGRVGRDDVDRAVSTHSKTRFLYEPRFIIRDLVTSNARTGVYEHYHYHIGAPRQDVRYREIDRLPADTETPRE